MSGSAGVLVPPVGYLQRLREICDQHNILLIFDEVITAFGRLGTYSGAEYFGVTPDLMNVAKQVTNGAVPMGAVIASSEIYDTFMNQALPEHAVEFSHGYTYSAHPVACAAGLAALDILARDNLVQQSAELAPHFEKVPHGPQGAKNVIDIRNCGLAGAIQIAPRDGDPTVRPFEAGMKLWQQGFYVRFGGDTLQFGPTFNARPEELDRCSTRSAKRSTASPDERPPASRTHRAGGQRRGDRDRMALRPRRGNRAPPPRPRLCGGTADRRHAAAGNPEGDRHAPLVAGQATSARPASSTT